MGILSSLGGSLISFHYNLKDDMNEIARTDPGELGLKIRDKYA